MTTLAAVRRHVGAADGEPLPAYSWPGAYPLVYMTRDGLVICPACANDPDTSDPVVSGDVYWEGPDMACDDGSQCGAWLESPDRAYGSWVPGMIASAYGDPDDES